MLLWARTSPTLAKLLNLCITLSWLFCSNFVTCLCHSLYWEWHILWDFGQSNVPPAPPALALFLSFAYLTCTCTRGWGSGIPLNIYTMSRNTGFTLVKCFVKTSRFLAQLHWDLLPSYRRDVKQEASPYSKLSHTHNPNQLTRCWVWLVPADAQSQVFSSALSSQIIQVQRTLCGTD